MDKKQKIIYIITILISALYIFIGNKVANQNYIMRDKMATGVPEKMKILKIIDPDYDKTVYGESNGERSETIILFEGEILTGYRKGTIERAVQRVDNLYAVEMRKVEEGQTIIVYDNPDPSVDAKYMFAEYHRVTVLWVLAAVFCVILVLFGRSKGLNTLISLIFTISSIFWVYIPAILSNGNIYLWSIVTCAYIILMTLFIVSGYTKKSFAAIIGCFIGVTISGLLVFFADNFLHMTGLVNEDSMYLIMLNPDSPIDIKAIIFGSIIIGAVGAIMDVAMSISASLAELKEKAPNLSSTQLIRSGFVIGRDILGTMANTLILAYIGSSLSVTLLLFAYNSSTLLLFNTEMIVVELLQAIAGSFGIILTIPLTSIICGILYAKDKK